MRVTGFEEEDLGRSPGVPVEPQAGRNDLGFVDDEEIARLQQVGQIGDVAVLRRRVTPVDEELGSVAWFDRNLGDARRVERVVEVLQAHTGRLRIRGPPADGRVPGSRP